MPRGKTRKASPVQELSGAVGDFLAQAQVTLNRGWKAAAEALPASPDKVVQGLSKRVNKTVKNLQKSRKEVIRRVEKTVGNLDRRRQRVLKAVEKRGSEIVGAAEARTAEALRPIAKRLDIASQHQVEQLQQRLARVESKLGGGAKGPRQTRQRRRAA